MSVLDTPRLVVLAQQGKTEAMNVLLCRYVPRVRKIVTIRMGPKLKGVVDPDDVVQDALTQVFSGIRLFKPITEGSFRNWVARLTENEIIDHLRKATTKRETFERRALRGHEAGVSLSKLMAPDGDWPSKKAEQRELEAKVEEALSQLPKHHREIIVLHTLCEMEFTEVAVTMGFESANTARQMYFRAMEKLREKCARLE
jgi:RNA polymerase sigma-70 factor (ECF subfamily)